ncbi:MULTISPECIES: hypothetical protein [unclassified Mesorhizobium]|uniref:hypothetical protein n=1 Tax=unclassified Mesorhizobium TaxID=325217 RepID=UPI0015E46258|nr:MULTISPECIES: hypothetical protein [unclassified Mesorhizobium]MBZ9704603.1 hypothetical protein [Mesorhizobium sp. CO1-1-3]MBZ9950363.1 hypothetical protein [Mesorhizobium sp. BR1-1-11]
MTQVKSVIGRIDLRQALSRFGDALLRGPYPAAKREIDADATVSVQHFFRAFEGKFSSANSLPGLGQFHVQEFDHCSATEFAVPSVVNPPRPGLVPGWGSRLRTAGESRRFGTDLIAREVAS